MNTDINLRKIPMVAKPIWCKCRGHSWTRRQLYSAWEKGRPVRCPAPECQREIPVETVETLLIDLGMVFPDDQATDYAADG